MLTAVVVVLRSCALICRGHRAAAVPARNSICGIGVRDGFLKWAADWLRSNGSISNSLVVVDSQGGAMIGALASGDWRPMRVSSVRWSAVRPSALTHRCRA